MASYSQPLDTRQSAGVPLRPWLTVREVALILALCPRTIRRLISAGQIAAVSTSAVRGRLRVSREALDDFLRRSVVQADTKVAAQGDRS
jgi:excisionase family DNA binding protein